MGMLHYILELGLYLTFHLEEFSIHCALPERMMHCFYRNKGNNKVG